MTITSKRKIRLLPPPKKNFKLKSKRIIRLKQFQDHEPPVDQTSDREQRINSLVRSLRSEIRTISDTDLQDQWESAMNEVAKDGDLNRMIELTTYRRKLVDMDEFLYSNTYLGLDRNELFPGVTEALHELDSDKYVEAVFKGAIGGGKSTVANIGIPRQLYKLSCMRNPQQTFGVQQHSSLVFTIQSVRLSTAKKAVFEELGKYINNSPYFNKIYPYDQRIMSSMIFRSQNVVLLPVSSSDTGAISMNVIGGILDEVNFMQKVVKSKHNSADEEGTYDQAKALYETLSRRRRSRFMYQGKLPGMLYLISSSRYPDDFTEVKAREAAMMGGTDDQIYVWSKSLWESKGRDRYSPTNFKVLVGDERNKSRIIEDDEDVPEHSEIIEVPTDLKSEFVKDINGAIRDFAGRTTLASHPFIQNPEAIYTAMGLADQYGYTNCIELETVDLNVSTPQASERLIRDDVKNMRVAHVDLAVTRDSAGLAIGHLAGTKTINRTNPLTGAVTPEVLPVIAYDLILRITPPLNGEIDFSKIREILYSLRDNFGLPIKIITTDGFQSVDFRQILAKKGFQSDYVSVDRTTQPYKTFRDALYDGRIILPRNQYLVTELAELEYVRHGAKEKVDHKPRGSKDVADACAAVAQTLLTRRGAWTSQPQYQGTNGMMLHGNRTLEPSIVLPSVSDETYNQLYKGGRPSIERRKSPERSSRELNKPIAKP